ncbi:hypothetical protein AWE89_22645 [Escherichia coli]|nr:hypothetical protein AWE89_22645 [Escherichia coli]
MIVRLSVKMAIIIWLGKKNWLGKYGERLSSDIGNSPFLYVHYVMIRIRIILMKSVKLISTLKNRIYVQHA